MTYDRPPAFIPATPEYVLAAIRDSYRQQCQYDPETEPDVDLTFNTTIDEWRSACDLIPWRELGRVLDDEWSLGRPQDAWRTVLTPEWKRTLRTLCEFISEGAIRPSIEPATILGTTCLPAGAFLAVRSLLRDAGANVDSVRPSTPLDEYTRDYLGVFLGPISRLAPNAIPDAQLSMSGTNQIMSLLESFSTVGYLISILIVQIGYFLFRSPLVVAGGTILAVVSLAATRMTVHDSPQSQVVFGSLRTFGDLARVLADGSQTTGRPQRTTDGAG
jgi:hypothetical protein